VIPFEDIKGDWKKLGSGSFGNVYKGSYLGIDVAIKEILPSNEYDVAKYFEREWRLLKESRHPNVVLYLGLSRAPDPDGRVFIISEFIENGVLRSSRIYLIFNFQRQETYDSTSGTSPNHFHGVFVYHLPRTLRVHWHIYTPENAFTAISRERIFWSQRMCASR